MKRGRRTGHVSVKPVGSEDQQQFGGVALHEPVSGVVEKNVEKDTKTLSDKKNLLLEKNDKNINGIENLSNDLKGKEFKESVPSYVPFLVDESEETHQLGGEALHNNKNRLFQENTKVLLNQIKSK